MSQPNNLSPSILKDSVISSLKSPEIYQIPITPQYEELKLPRTLLKPQLNYYSLSRMMIFLRNSLNQPSKSACLRVFSHFFGSKSTQSLYESDASNNLYKRISPLGDPNISVVPVLDQWVSEGKTVDKEKLKGIIKELRAYKRYKHALEVSQWMTDKRYMPLTAKDASVRMNLIYRVDGMKQVENYFSNVGDNLKGFEVYITLLNCYALDKCVEKAEAIMQKVRDMGYATSPLPYNIIMNLHHGLGNSQKLDDLMNEMEGKGIHFDLFTLTIRLSAYAAASDAEGVDKIVMMMESDPRIVVDYNGYAIAAQGYVKVGQLDKALAMLKKMEGLARTTRKRYCPFDLLLKLYAGVERKDDVYRIWNMYKQEQKIYNKGYMSMMSSLLKFGDVEGTEKIFEEWESRGLPYDYRVPNILINTYCRHGQLEKAEALVSKGSLKGGKPFTTTWYYMAIGYILDNEISKALEALKKAILTCPPNYKPSKETLTTCLEYLERRGDVEKAEEFIRLLKAENVFPGVDHDKLLHYVKYGEWQSQVHGEN